MIYIKPCMHHNTKRALNALKVALEYDTSYYKKKNEREIKGCLIILYIITACTRKIIWSFVGLKLLSLSTQN